MSKELNIPHVAVPIELLEQALEPHDLSLVKALPPHSTQLGRGLMNACGLCCAEMLQLWMGRSIVGGANHWNAVIDAARDGSTALDLSHMLSWFGLTPIMGRDLIFPAVRDEQDAADMKALDIVPRMMIGDQPYPKIILCRYNALPHQASAYAGSTFLHWILRCGPQSYNDPLYRTSEGAGLLFASESAGDAVELSQVHVGIAEHPAVIGDGMPLYKAKDGSDGARFRTSMDTSNNANIAGTWPEGPTFSGEPVAGTTWIKVKAKLGSITVDGVEVPASGANPNRIIELHTSTVVAELAKPPPTPPPVSTDVTTARRLFGVHELGGRNRAGDALALGCEAVMCFESATGAYQLAKQYPQAIVMHRKYFKYQMAAAELLAQHGINVNETSDSRVWYRGFNENDVQGIGSGVDSIPARARFDVECATLLKRAAPNAKWIAGGFAHGNPDFTNPDICRVMREVYAPHYNSGLFGAFDMHNYTKPAAGYGPKDFKTISPIWLKRNWEFLFTHCGFNPSIRRIVHSEAGHECGFGGMNQAGFTVDEYSEWCDWTWLVQTAPLVIGNTTYPSPVLCEAGFQWGDENSGSGGWWGYSLSPYIGHMKERWDGRIVTRLGGGKAPPHEFIYEGETPPYEVPPPKSMAIP